MLSAKRTSQMVLVIIKDGITRPLQAANRLKLFRDQQHWTDSYRENCEKPHQAGNEILFAIN